MQGLIRRQFLSRGALGLGGAWIGMNLGACGGAKDAADLQKGVRDAETPDAGEGHGDAQAIDTGAADASLPLTCGERTAPNIEGPFFTPNSPERKTLRLATDPGPVLSISGRVLRRDCVPIDNAILDFWHADANGAYDNTGFDHRGHQRVEEGDGRWSLETLVPGRYLNGNTYRPAHIHVKVGAPGFKLLTTQLYFEGDPFNATDPFIDTSLIMSLQERFGALHARFDFVLAPLD